MYYIQISRDLGCVEGNNGKMKYYVGNGRNLVTLKQYEYDVWRSTRKMQSVDTWREVMSKRIRSMTSSTIEEIESKLLELNTLHTLDFDSPSDEVLKKLFVIRNGYAFGQRGNYWIIGTYNQKRMFQLGSEEEYQLWIIASSYKSLHSIIDTISKKNNISLNASLRIVSRLAKTFVRAGIWTIEYQENGGTEQ